MPLGGGRNIVVKMVNDNRCSIWGEVNVEFEQEGIDCTGCARFRRQRKEDITARIRKVKEDLRGQ